MEDTLKERLKARAREFGFDSAAIAPASLPDETGEHLEAFLALGRHGDMDWMAAHADRRRSPTALWPQARSALVVATNYGPESDPMARLEATSTGVVSVYAQRRDYHDVMKGKLKQLAQWIAHDAGASVKVFVDTAPLMEKPLAQRAGIGWQGKHTNLVSRRFGSWLFLGVLLTDLELEPDGSEADHCGQCRACLDVCPTKAFPAPYQLDARRCISYLTIEHKGHIDREFRAAMGNRIYGCDDCLAVCPWNKFAQAGSEARLAVNDALAAPPLADLAGSTTPRFASCSGELRSSARAATASCATCSSPSATRATRACCPRCASACRTPRNWCAPWRCGHCHGWRMKLSSPRSRHASCRARPMSRCAMNGWQRKVRHDWAARREMERQRPGAFLHRAFAGRCPPAPRTLAST
jgi:epoxyqueuosine reductase